PKTDDAPVDIWSYRDSKLQSQQLKELNPKTYLAVLRISDKRLFPLEGLDDHFRGSSNTYALVTHIPGDPIYDEWYWNSAVQSSVTLISLADGSRKTIANNLAASV